MLSCSTQTWVTPSFTASGGPGGMTDPEVGLARTGSTAQGKGHVWPLSAQAVLQRKLWASDLGWGRGLSGQKKQRIRTTPSSTESSCTGQTGRETQLDTPTRGDTDRGAGQISQH